MCVCVCACVCVCVCVCEGCEIVTPWPGVCLNSEAKLEKKCLLLARNPFLGMQSHTRSVQATDSPSHTVTATKQKLVSTALSTFPQTQNLAIAESEQCHCLASSAETFDSAPRRNGPRIFARPHRNTIVQRTNWYESLQNRSKLNKCKLRSQSVCEAPQTFPTAGAWAQSYNDAPIPTSTDLYLPVLTALLHCARNTR